MSYKFVNRTHNFIANNDNIGWLTKLELCNTSRISVLKLKEMEMGSRRLTCQHQEGQGGQISPPPYAPRKGLYLQQRQPVRHPNDSDVHIFGIRRSEKQWRASQLPHVKPLSSLWLTLYSILLIVKHVAPLISRIYMHNWYYIMCISTLSFLSKEHWCSHMVHKKLLLTQHVEV